MSNQPRAFYSHPASYYNIKTGHGELHIHIDHGEKGPVRIFTDISPVGSEVAGLTSALGIMISKYLELGGDPNKIVKHLCNIRGDRPLGFGDNRVNSIPAAVATILKKCLESKEELAAA